MIFVIIILIIIVTQGVFSQSLTVSGGTCPEDNVVFTCEVNSIVVIWNITTDSETRDCSFSLSQSPDPCGPGLQFTPSVTVINATTNLFLLSVELNTGLSGTLVSCREVGIMVNVIGSVSISVADNVIGWPQFIKRDDMISGAGEGEDEWIVRVEWSEVMDNVGSPVSQYELCVTPFTASNHDGCTNNSTTHYDLILKSNTNYTLAVRGICGDINGEMSEPVHLQVIDGTKYISIISPNYNHSTGILESITLTHGGFSLEKHTNVDNIVVVTSETEVTIPVPPDVIAEYRPTITAGVTGAPTISLSSFPIASELNSTDLARDVVSVDISGSCSSIVTCLEGNKCTVHCGYSADINGLNKRNSSTSVSDRNIEVRLPPMTAKHFYCIVSSTIDDDSLLFRIRTVDDKSGCPLNGLFTNNSREKDPECMEKENECFCHLNSNDGRYGFMYNSTSVGSTAVLFTSSEYCYSGSQSETLLCGSNEMWVGPIITEQQIEEAKLENTLNDAIITLIAIGVVCLVVGLHFAVVVVALLIKHCKRDSKFFWFLSSAASVVTIFALILWIVVLVILPGKGGINDQSGRRRNPNTSLCENVDSNDNTRVPLVIVCAVMSAFVLIIWLASLIALIVELKSSHSKEKEKPEKSMLQSILKSCCKERRQETLATTNIPQPYEEVIEVKSSQLTSNEAYGPIRNDSGINTTPNTAYGQVQSSSSSTAPPANYEEVRDIERRQDIQLTSNEAYGPIQRSNIQTSPNKAYGQVDL